MKTTMLLFTCIIFINAYSQKPLFDQRAGNLRLAVDGSGKITALMNITDGTNYVAPDGAMYLLECQKYGAEGGKPMLHPESMKIVKQSPANTKVELTCKEGVRLTVLITPKKDYFKMELTDAVPIADIGQIVWGPYQTTMRGPIGEWLGLIRSNNFTIGLLSLEPHTDGIAASYTQVGSSLQLYAFDNNRERFVGTENENLRRAVPVPDLTVKGSAVALFGCQTGKNSELGVIERIELGEGLPHQMYKGQWNKYSKEGKKLCLWTNYNDPEGVGEKNFAECLRVSKEMGARILCRMHGFSKNWGHFDIEPKIYPGGIQAILANSKMAQSEGIGLTLYSLTTFTKPHPDPEPYLAPVPDDRLQIWKPKSILRKDISVNDKQIILQYSDDFSAALKAASNKVIRIGNELIEFKSFSVKDNEVIAEQCERGAFFTGAVNHAAGSNVRLMYVSGFHNFYPGTLDMSNEQAERLGNIIVDADLDNFVVDGFESCLETGYGNYTGSIFLKTIFDKCSKNNKEILLTGSGFSNYSWHYMSHISWGEYDLQRGFRGTMLDYRLYRQIQLKRNLMPNKLGQYYPNDATAEDIEWLMALVAGWDSGVDFTLNFKQIQNNPDYKRIVATLHLWQEAIAGNVFSEKQKMALRQTDVLYKLSRKADGGWDLKFDRFWQNDKVRILPPSVMEAKEVNGGPKSVKPRSIDWSWTHNPGLYDEIGLSDDLVHRTGPSETSWTVKYPLSTESKRSSYPGNVRHFQFVIRLPKEAPCGVKNFKISINNQMVEIPAELQPGQYISIPHLIEMACIYDTNHQITKEVYLHGNLPKVENGTTAKVSLSCEPVDGKSKPEVILNVRCQNGYFFIAN